MATTAKPAVMDGLSPPPPGDAYFDRDTGAWILSRYADVLAAFRDARLYPVGPRGEDQGDTRDKNGVLHLRHEVQDALSTDKVAEWQRAMESLVDRSLDSVNVDQSHDLLEAFAKPWCMSLALTVTDADVADRPLLSDLGRQVFAGTGELPESPLKASAAAATDELKRYFESSSHPMAEATFIGISQTLPRLLVNGWLALFRVPTEASRLRDEPHLMPCAVEELLRYAGIIPALYRKAREDVRIGTVRIAAGDRVHLMIASANRDPEKYPDPDRLDVSRRATGQLALGIGRSSCAGARVIRMANGVALGAILRTFSAVDIVNSTLWRTGSGFCWPASVHVALRR